MNWAEPHCSRKNPTDLGGVLPQEAEVYRCICMSWAEPHCSRVGRSFTDMEFHCLTMISVVEFHR